MNQLISALTSGDALTANGAITNSTTDSALLDLFAVMGSLRGQTEDTIINLWIKAFNEHSIYALQMLLWCRDCRGGAGERRTFRIIYNWLKKNKSDIAHVITQKIYDVGRWDDMWKSGDLSGYELDVIKNNLDNSLLCKWLPRKGKEFYVIAKHCKMSYGDFRRHLAKHSKTVEQQMSKNDWANIVYPHVPSKAMSIYSKAFGKHDQKRFGEFITKLEKGEVKVNASTLFPHDLIKDFYSGKNQSLIAEQWKALPNYSSENENILVVADVSGSMTSGCGSVLPIHASIALAIYASERNAGMFKDYFITFSSTPKLQKLSGTFPERVRQLQTAEWGMSTDLQAVFNLILNQAIKYKVPANEMPTKVIIISDMEFNSCCANSTNFETISKKFNQSEYQLPSLVFWNVNGRPGNNPIKLKDKNVALISGYSPSVIPAILGDSINPLQIMLNTICKERYSVSL